MQKIPENWVELAPGEVITKECKRSFQGVGTWTKVSSVYHVGKTYKGTVRLNPKTVVIKPIVKDTPITLPNLSLKISSEDEKNKVLAILKNSKKIQKIYEMDAAISTLSQLIIDKFNYAYCWLACDNAYNGNEKCFYVDIYSSPASYLASCKIMKLEDFIKLMKEKDLGVRESYNNNLFFRLELMVEMSRETPY